MAPLASPNGHKIDQLADLIDMIKTNPTLAVNFNGMESTDVTNMALPPCHCLFQFHVANGRLSCQLYQRSADSFLDVPFNIASYALLTMITAVCGLKVGEFVHTFGDAHLYANHFEQARTQLERQPTALPNLLIHNVPERIDDFKYDDFEIVDYVAAPNISAPIAI